MKCPLCSVELQIFPKGDREIYVCPECLSALMANEDALEPLKSFCSREVLTDLIDNMFEPSFFTGAKKILKPADGLNCPQCKSRMENYDFGNKTKFFVNKCPGCGSIWLNKVQIPLVTMALLKDSAEDRDFKRAVNELYKTLAARRSSRIRSIDEMIEPYIAIPLSFLGYAFPAGDNVLTKRYPYVTVGIIVLCAFMFFPGEPAMTSLSLIADKVVKEKEFYRLITAAFLHAGILHILGNMWFLWVFGRSVEDRMGRVPYAALFLTSAVFSSILFIATIKDGSVPCVGASGAISGVIGAYLILLPKAKIKFNIYWKYGTQRFATYAPSWAYILVWILMNVFFGMMEAGSKTVGVAYWGHIGGFVGGIIFAEMYKNLKRV
ncbi:MAG: rhomboid family intramembrane serine protease [Candidatus Omnitrophica bacterium]|nr:rhomboid family intramembrane serine protease [Candidatus Omnitrophota bacterium]